MVPVMPPPFGASGMHARMLIAFTFATGFTQDTESPVVAQVDQTKAGSLFLLSRALRQHRTGSDDAGSGTTAERAALRLQRGEGCRRSGPKGMQRRKQRHASQQCQMERAIPN